MGGVPDPQHAGRTNGPGTEPDAVFPLAAILVSFVRTRHADGIGVISLVFIVGGVAASLISGDVHFVLVKDSFFTGLFGLVFLGSLLGPRPLMFYFGRSFLTGGDPARIAWWNGLWEYPQFRRVICIMTAVWGVAYVVEASVRVVLAFVLPPSTVLALSPVLALGVTILLITWTMSYSGRAQRRAAQIREPGLEMGGEKRKTKNVRVHGGRSVLENQHRPPAVHPYVFRFSFFCFSTVRASRSAIE